MVQAPDDQHITIESLDQLDGHPGLSPEMANLAKSAGEFADSFANDNLDAFIQSYIKTGIEKHKVSLETAAQIESSQLIRGISRSALRTGHANATMQSVFALPKYIASNAELCWLRLDELPDREFDSYVLFFLDAVSKRCFLSLGFYDEATKVFSQACDQDIPDGFKAVAWMPVMFPPGYSRIPGDKGLVEILPTGNAQTEQITG